MNTVLSGPHFVQHLLQTTSETTELLRTTKWHRLCAFDRGGLQIKNPHLKIALANKIKHNRSAYDAVLGNEASDDMKKLDTYN